MSMQLDSVRILIAEDAADNLFLLTLVLEDEGAEVVGVTSGEEALAKLREQEFNVALLDISLPDLDGDKVAIKLAEECNPVKKLALTGHIGLPKKVENAFDLILQKPIMPDKLIKSIVDILA